MTAPAGDRHTVLSLGAGVQSSVLALMAARGEFPTSFGRPRACVFADTGSEPAFVYRHLEWLQAELERLGLPVHLVRATRKDGAPASLQDDVLAVVRRWRERAATPPVFVKASVEFNPHPMPGAQARFVRQVGGQAHFVVVPVFARTFTGKKGQLRRQCTGDYKLEPIYRWLRPFVGRPPGIRATRPPFVEMWIGISAEERATRCKPSVHAWVDNRWPLRELGMTRRDCARWAWDAYRTVFPKSACVACPLHDDEFWAWLRAYHREAWAEAVAFDREIRRLPMVQGECYLHRSCLPLDEGPLTPEDRGQSDFLALLDLHDACAFH